VDWRTKVRTVPDFPEPGVLFRDLLPVLADGEAFRQLLDELSEAALRHRPEVLVAPEARGFLVGAPLAARLGVGLVAVRKPGKLPGQVVSQDYALEYGISRLEAAQDAPLEGRRALVVDDVLATGGTVQAAAALVRRLGGEVVGFLFALELAALKGRDRLQGAAVDALWVL
jgi:adenine phosphoribosyltransferase